MMKVKSVYLVVFAAFVAGAALASLALQPAEVLKTVSVTVTETNTQFSRITVTEYTGITKTLTSLSYTTVTEKVTTTRTVTRLVTITEEAGEGVEVLDICFSPDGDCLEVLLSFIQNARESVYVMIYVFTLDDVADALIDAAARGVDVKVLIEADSAFIRGSEYSRLAENGVEVRLDRNRYLMHNKVAVIDGRIVITGSMNWSFRGAFRNNENIIVLEDPDTAAEFIDEFNKLWRLAG